MKMYNDVWINTLENEISNIYIWKVEGCDDVWVWNEFPDMIWNGKFPHTTPVAYPGGGFRVFKPPPREIPKALQKIVPNSTRLWKLLKKIAEFRTPTH